jgi:hypothetical protein
MFELLILKLLKMKKLGKLSINPEKVIKNEELVNLKGGSYYDCPGMNCDWNQLDYYCECVNSVGTWCTCASHRLSAEAEAYLFCASGQATCMHYLYT